MEYYKKIWYDGNEKEIEENKYLIMMDLDKDELKKISKNDKVVSRYMEDLENINKIPEFREFMTYEMDKEIIHNTEINEATRKGIEQGAKERNVEIAKNMLSVGEPIDKIMLYTGLTKEEIDKLQ